MNIEEIKITSGENDFQTAVFEPNDKVIDYETSRNLSYVDILNISKGLEVISEFFDVKAAVAIKGMGICAVSLGKTVEEAIKNVIDANPIDFISSIVVVSEEVESNVAKLVKSAGKIVAPSYTKNAADILEANEICYVTIKTPLKEYKKYLSNDIKITPLGTLNQSPNLSELNKDTFKVVSKTKPTVEQIEDAVFAWKVAKHTNSQAIVIAKDLRTTAISQGKQSFAVEYALNYSCDMSKDAILASDMPITVHDVEAAAQGRISLIIIPYSSREVEVAADKFNLGLITTGFTNILY